MDIPVKDRVDIRFHFSGIDTQEWNRQLEVSPLSCLFTMATAPFQSHQSLPPHRQHLLLHDFSFSPSLWWCFIPYWLMMLSVFSCARRLSATTIFSGEMSVQILCPFFPWDVCLLLSWKSSINILDTRLWSDTWFAGICSHSVVCLFTFLMVSSEVQKSNFYNVQFNVFSLLLMLLVLDLRIFCQI